MVQVLTTMTALRYISVDNVKYSLFPCCKWRWIGGFVIRVTNIYSNVQHFNSIIADLSDVIFQQVITFGCLSKLLTWAKAEQQSLKSSADNTGSLPTDLSVYCPCSYIKKIHTRDTWR